jgi:hypothetical protein
MVSSNSVFLNCNLSSQNWLHIPGKYKRFYILILDHLLGHAIAQAVSRRLPTAVAGVRTQVRSCGICDGQSGTGKGFLRVLRFPLPILIPLTIPHSSSSIIWGLYNRPNRGQCTEWTQSHPTSSKLRKLKQKKDHKKLKKFISSVGRWCI